MLIYSKWRPKSRFLESFQHNLEICYVICLYTVYAFWVVDYKNDTFVGLTYTIDDVYKIFSKISTKFTNTGHIGYLYIVKALRLY